MTNVTEIYFGQRSAEPEGELIGAKFIDAEVPGFQAEFAPHEADLAGAFMEDALSEEDAAESSEDLMDRA